MAPTSMVGTLARLSPCERPPPSSWSQLMGNLDPFRETGPYGIAKACDERIAELEASKAVTPRAERGKINKQIHTLKQMRDWCRTRAGYVEPAR